MKTKYQIMIDAGFVHASWRTYDSPLAVTQVANEDSLPVAGSRNRPFNEKFPFAGRFPFANLIAPDKTTFDDAISGRLFGDE